MYGPQYIFERERTSSADLFIVSAPCAAARLLLPYDIHVRPATFLFENLKEKPYFPSLRLRPEGTTDWSDFEIISLLSRGFTRGTPVEIQLSSPAPKEAVLEVLDAFQRCPLFRSYPEATPPPQPGPLPGAGSDLDERTMADFRQDYEDLNRKYSLLKLNLENFILANNLLIEAWMDQRGDCALDPARRAVQDVRQILVSEVERQGLILTGTSFDNLLQMRDMCYAHYFENVKLHMALPHREVEIRWAGSVGQAWRQRQRLRLRYFFDREQDFYGDLFLLTLLHERPRLEAFLARWTDRLDYSLRLRGELEAELGRFQDELRNFRPNFDDPDRFGESVSDTCRAVVREVTRFTPFLQMIRQRRLCFPGAAAAAPPGASRP